MSGGSDGDIGGDSDTGEIRNAATKKKPLKSTRNCAQQEERGQDQGMAARWRRRQQGEEHLSRGVRGGTGRMVGPWDFFLE